MAKVIMLLGKSAVLLLLCAMPYPSGAADTEIRKAVLVNGSQTLR